LRANKITPHGRAAWKNPASSSEKAVPFRPKMVGLTLRLFSDKTVLTPFFQRATKTIGIF
jgi:hypothetical protein